jgi:hypothetical protein
MACSRSTAIDPVIPDGGGAVHVEEDRLELNVTSPRDIALLRHWIRRVNGSAYPQPYLVEGPPGRFRLYVGDAAVRVRSRHGIR